MHPADLETHPGSNRPEAQAQLHLHPDDEAALEALFRAEFEGLCDFVERYVRTAAVAEEVVQEVFLRVWRRRAALPPSTITRSYLYAAARNMALQHVRHERVDLRWRAGKAPATDSGPAPESTGPADAADAGLAVSELEAAAEQAIASLPPRCRLVFTLSRQQGLRYTEIAETLGISVGTVEIQMNRALKALRVKLAPYLLLLLAVLQ